MDKEKKPYINANGERISKDEYDNLKFDKFLVRVPKGKKAIIQEYASTKGESLNGFINRLIDETIALEVKENE